MAKRTLMASSTPMRTKGPVGFENDQKTIPRCVEFRQDRSLVTPTTAILSVCFLKFCLTA